MTLVGPATYDHVVILMEENLSFAAFKANTQIPYLKGLKASCGSEGNMHAATHPSQPNYMATTSGIASGVGVKTSNPNIFQQIPWKSYIESMPSNCATRSGGYYKTGHNPAVWYTNLTDCAANDVPFGVFPLFRTGN